MKKIKKVLTLLVAFAMTLCVFAMAACEETPATGGETHVCEHVCETCEKCTDNECDDPVCEDKCPGHEVVPPAHECKHVCETCEKCTDNECNDPVCKDKCPGHEVVTPAHECKHVCETCEKCTDNECGDSACAEKCEGHEEHEIYTITLVVGEGTLPEGAKSTYTTNAEGMLELEEGKMLPVPSISKAHWKFDNWYDAETGGNAIVEDETVFTQDTTIYARYIRDNGVWSGENAETWKIALVKNTGATGVIAEYWFGGANTKISVEEGEKLSLYLDGRLISAYAGGAVGVKGNKSDSQKSDYVTVTVTGELNLYLKLYSHATDPDNYVCEWLGATKVETGTEVPEGCDAIKFTFSGGVVVTIYLVDNTGKAVGKDDFSNFCVYTYNGEAFGNWTNSASKTFANNGILKEEMSASVALPSGWIFRWGSSYSQQTANIIDIIKGGKTYLVKLPSTNKAVAEILELNLAE